MLNRIQKIGVGFAGAASTAYTAALVLAQGKTDAATSNDALGTAIDPGIGWSPDFGALINSILSIVMVVALLLVLLYLILGGIEWITSGGDKGKTESARNKITAAVIGIIILAAAYALVTLVAWVLGFDGGIDGAFDTINRIGE
jgi:hypothetical protein